MTTNIYIALQWTPNIEENWQWGNIQLVCFSDILVFFCVSSRFRLDVLAAIIWRWGDAIIEANWDTNVDQGEHNHQERQPIFLCKQKEWCFTPRQCLSSSPVCLSMCSVPLLLQPERQSPVAGVPLAEPLCSSTVPGDPASSWPGMAASPGVTCHKTWLCIHNCLYLSLALYV